MSYSNQNPDGVSYPEFEEVEEDFQSFLDESLNPRGREALFDLVANLDLPRGGIVVDVGCGRGRDALELCKRFDLRVKGVDPAPRNVQEATAVSSTRGLAGCTEFSVGVAEALPVPDASAHLIWCKEVLMFVDLRLGFEEFARVLQPGGFALVYQVMTGPRMTEEEAQRFWTGELGYGPARSVLPADIEQAAAAAGLILCDRVDFGSEWGEFNEERNGSEGRRLLHAARLIRDPEHYIGKYGEANYQIMLGDCLWHVYRMIGKLHGAALVFAKGN